MLYIYAPVIYPGTRELMTTLNARRLVRHDGMRYLHKGVPVEFSPSDAIVCWGHHAPPVDKVPTLNSSYKYRDMLQLNAFGLQNALGKVGYTVFGLTRMVDSDYVKDLVEIIAAGGKVKVAPHSGYVPQEEFDGYGIRHYKFSSTAKVVMFGGNVIHAGSSDDTRLATNMNKVLGFDFATYYFGKAPSISVLLKVTTAPVLDAAGVKQYAKLIAKWYKSTSEKNKMAEDLEKLLEE